MWEVDVPRQSKAGKEEVDSCTQYKREYKTWSEGSC